LAGRPAAKADWRPSTSEPCGERWAASCGSPDRRGVHSGTARGFAPSRNRLPPYIGSSAHALYAERHLGGGGEQVFNISAFLGDFFRISDFAFEISAQRGYVVMPARYSGEPMRVADTTVSLPPAIK